MPSLATILKKLFFLIFVSVFVLFTSCQTHQKKYKKIQGNVFGTTFQVKYYDSLQRNFSENITNIFQNYNASLSTYHTNSTISQFNNAKNSIKVDAYFQEVFKLSQKINTSTNGYFDPTVGTMVNAWGFGPKKIKQTPNDTQVDSLMQFVGLDKVALSGDVLTKEKQAVFLDFNAIAKGYAVDVVALFLEQHGIVSYLVEIGGEIRAKGTNAKQSFWSVGIEEPNFDGTRSLQKIVHLNNEAIATSGNYRKYKTDSITGVKIAHTLNPKTGKPAVTDLLSASVITSQGCGVADAYATAFMAMGYAKANKLAKSLTDLKVYFIYLEDNELKTYGSPSLNFVE